jgi:pimeloyl-ACP methyl ester carboxylesterase
MSRFVLVPGSGGSPWYWHRVVPLLEASGHEAVPVDLPGDDPTAGLEEYVRIVLRAVGDQVDVVLVASSLGGFVVPLVAEQTAVRAIVLVNAMIPLQGETAGEWWSNTGAVDARETAAMSGGYRSEFDPMTYFLHDVPQEVIADGESRQREESQAVFASICDFMSWPRVPIRVVAGREDRFFPCAFQRRVAMERLRLEVDELPGGHLIALARPAELASYLVSI